ncbi:MAG: hypothetical protein GY782_05380 [Gammaproteobacteria bacterium]|nr:hypothetical protein [Gammaproteobacteria bacterium]
MAIQQYSLAVQSPQYTLAAGNTADSLRVQQRPPQYILAMQQILAVEQRPPPPSVHFCNTTELSDSTAAPPPQFNTL